MSFSNINQAPARLNRSQLFVLANRTETFEAAATSEADVIMFEIEDAIPPDEKLQARKNIIEALNDIDWGKKSISMRINGLDTPYMYRDLVDILEGPRRIAESSHRAITPCTPRDGSTFHASLKSWLG